MIPHATASANILRHVETGTLIQGAWHRRRACGGPGGGIDQIEAEIGSAS